MADINTITLQINNAFRDTWVTIQGEAIDNILTSNVVTDVLRKKGCFKTQEGGHYIPRSVKYALPSATEVGKGAILPQGEVETETTAQWTWRYFAAGINRSMFDDQVNRGVTKLQDYVVRRTNEVMDTLKLKVEDYIVGTTKVDSNVYQVDTDSTVQYQKPQGLLDIVPPAYIADNTTSTTGHTYGQLEWYPLSTDDGMSGAGGTTRTWWAPRYKTATANPEVNLYADMQNFFNTIGDNMDPPDLILTTQAWFELYGNYALDVSMIVKNSNSADLGYEMLYFMGKPLSWSSKLTTAKFNSKNAMLFLNTKYIDVVTDPAMWMTFTNWNPATNQAESVGHVLSACNVVCSSRRRQGLLTEA